MFVKFDFVANTKANISIIVAIILIPFLVSKQSNKQTKLSVQNKKKQWHALPSSQKTLSVNSSGCHCSADLLNTELFCMFGVSTYNQ